MSDSELLKIYIGCFGSGLGHASRMLEIAHELTRLGAVVEFSSSGEVASLIRKRGYACNELPLADVRYSENGEFSLRHTVASSPSILGRTYHQLALELANVKRFGPRVVLSDSALSTVLAGRMLRIPTFTVLNQLNLNSSKDGGGVPSRLLSFGTSAAMGKFWALSDEVLLPDLPPPYTVSEKNLWGSNVSNVRYIGFLGPSRRADPDDAARAFRADPRPKIFWQVSGPPKTRSSILKKALEFSQKLSEKYVFVITGGSPTSGSEAEKVAGGWFYGWCAIPEYYFDSCDVVVSRAGHGTIGQAIMASRPSLLIPIPRQPEQEGNADKAEKLGVSIKLEQGTLDIKGFEAAIHSLLGAPAQKRSRELGLVASRFNAKEEIVRTLLSAVT